MTATSYITYINANDGIKVHNESDMLNYLQLNSTAISMFRDRGDGVNSDEVLRIDDNGIRVGKANEAHFSLTSSRLAGYGDNNNVIDYNDDCLFVPIVRIFDLENKLILEKELPKRNNLDNLGSLILTKNKLTIKPKKNNCENLTDNCIIIT